MINFRGKTSITCIALTFSDRTTFRAALWGAADM